MPAAKTERTHFNPGVDTGDIRCVSGARATPQHGVSEGDALSRGVGVHHPETLHVTWWQKTETRHETSGVGPRFQSGNPVP